MLINLPNWRKWNLEIDQIDFINYPLWISGTIVYLESA